MVSPASCARAGCLGRRARWSSSVRCCRVRRGWRTRQGRRAMAWRGRCTRPGSGSVVAAPGKIERPSADRVKTDQRDGERVLRLLMIDGLHSVGVPSSKEEALRDVVRAREAVRGDLMRARQRLSKLLLRHDVIYEDTASAWTIRHRSWLTSIDLGQLDAQVTLHEYLGQVDAIVIRRDALEKTIAELIPGSPWEQTVARLRCLRGIDTLSAVGLCAEIGEFARFDRAGRLMRRSVSTPRRVSGCRLAVERFALGPAGCQGSREFPRCDHGNSPPGARPVSAGRSAAMASRWRRMR